jgi:hypothetical protein
MLNARDEFIEHVGNLEVKGAILCRDNKNPIILKAGHNRKEYEHFLTDIDFLYSSDLKLYGLISYVDDSWSDMDENNNWVHKDLIDGQMYINGERID